jgi:dTDP-4-amino-4,6-dideoxygalactose transaminase
VRPLDLTAAIGLNQFKRLNKMISVRTKNRELIINTIKNHKKYNNQFEFFYPIKDLKPSWFGMPLLINKNFKNSKNKYLQYLNFHRIETRPIISGNFLNQPSAKLYNLRPKNIIKSFPKSQEIEDRGFFIGLPTHPMSKNKINYLILFIILFLYNLQFTIYNKYYEPLIFIVSFLILELNLEKNFFGKKNYITILFFFFISHYLISVGRIFLEIKF